MKKFLRFALAWLLTAITFFLNSVFGKPIHSVSFAVLIYLLFVAEYYFFILSIEIGIVKYGLKKKLRTDRKWNAEELFNAYRGKTIRLDGRYTGRICGYTENDDCVIVAVKEGVAGWHCLASSDILLSDFENQMGYWYIGIANFIKQINPQDGRKKTS